MFQPRKWWAGLPVLGLIWLLANLWTGANVERDLTDRVTAALPANALDKPRVDAEGRDIRLAGAAFAPDGQTDALAASADVPGVRLVNSNLSLLPITRPYGFSAKLDAGKLTLGGSVPSPQVRAALLASAKAAAPKAVVIDQMSYASGQTENFSALATGALGAVSELASGSVQISDASWSLEGVAVSPQAYEKAQLFAKAPPPGLNPGKINVLPPIVAPYGFTATLADKSLVLTGSVPSISARDALEAKAAAIFPGVAVANRLGIARGVAAEATPALADQGLQQLRLLSAGVFAIEDKQVAISGPAKDGASVGAATQALRAALPAGFTLEAKVTAPPASPYLFEARRAGDALRLSGFAPDDAAHAQVVAAARAALPQAQMDDAVKVASGLPAGLDYAAATNFVIAEIAQTENGEAGFVNKDFSLIGEASQTVAAKQALDQALNHLPAGLAVKTLAVKDLQAEREAAARAEAERIAAAKVKAEQEAAAEAERVAAAKAEAEKAAVETAARLKAEQEAIATALAEAERLSAVKAQAEKAAAEAAAKAAAEQPAPSRTLSGQPVVVAQAATAALVAPSISAEGIAAIKSADGVTLTGVVRDEASRKKLLAVAARGFMGAKVIDQLQLSDKAPETLELAAEHGLRQLSRLQTGALTVDGGKIKLEGAALFAQASEDILGALKSEPVEGFAPEANLSLAPPQPPLAVAECGALIVDVAKQGVILFDTAKATISKDSAGTIDFIAAAALRCADARIEVSGHTDSDGDAKANLELSQRRAQAVVERLVKAGAKAEKITAVGFGEAKPIAPNDTPEGKAMNRRIEFAVTE